jgi:hypothetical protein
MAKEKAAFSSRCVGRVIEEKNLSHLSIGPTQSFESW